MTGRFITFEGGEGAGKSTQARMLAQRLAAGGIPVLLTREPGGTPAAERIRAMLVDRATAWSPAADMLLHFAARAEHVSTLLRPALASGVWVVCDRFYDSTMAYQGYGLGEDRAAIATLSRMVGLDPDLTILLDLPVMAGLSRVAARGNALDRYEAMGEGFLARVRQGFLGIAAAAPGRCHVVSAAGDGATVAARIAAVVRERLAVADAFAG